MWYTWPTGRETNCNARGVFATATYKGGPEIILGFLLRGSDRSPHTEAGANPMASPRPTYQKTTLGRLVQAAYLEFMIGGPFCYTTTWYKTASQSEQHLC